MVFAMAIPALPLAAQAASPSQTWINVDGPPAWVAGAAVDQKFRRDWRGANLAPGHWVANSMASRVSG